MRYIGRKTAQLGKGRFQTREESVQYLRNLAHLIIGIFDGQPLIETRCRNEVRLRRHFCQGIESATCKIVSSQAGKPYTERKGQE